MVHRTPIVGSVAAVQVHVFASSDHRYRLVLDKFEYLFYPAAMLASEAGRTLAAKLHSATRARARRRSPTSNGAARPRAELLQVTTQKTGLAEREQGVALGRDGNRLGESGREPAELQIKARADQELVPLRRGGGSEPTEYEILTPMESSSPESDIKPELALVSREGISVFIARVLDQLTLSAWLPAALFTAAAALLLQFRRQGSVNLLHAVRMLTVDPVRVLVLMIPLLVIATIVTQAFSFEAIRTLEGYWRRRGLAGCARTFMIRRHVRRKEATTRRRHRALERAFYIAEPRMLKDKVPFPVVNAHKAEAFEIEQPSLTDEEREEFIATDWRDWSDAWVLAKVDHLSNDKKAYPDTSRVLPTRLGNLLRATEDQLKNTGGDLQGFVLQQYALAPRRVQMQHDQFRNRLEMYCTLVFVSVSLLLLTPITLLGRGIDYIAIIIVSVSFAALSVASYLAALASAGGYCAALKQMDATPQGSDGS